MVDTAHVPGVYVLFKILAIDSAVDDNVPADSGTCSRRARRSVASVLLVGSMGLERF